MTNSKSKEALADLEDMERFTDSHAGVSLGEQYQEELANIRSALLAAQQEAEAWEVIGAWRALSPHYRRPALIQLFGAMGDSWFCELSRSDDIGLTHSVGRPTRLGALIAGAEWCRAEMAK